MRLTMQEESNRMGLMRLRIDGAWSVRDFRELLMTTENVYNDLDSAILLGDFVRAESERNDKLEEADRYSDREWYWTGIYRGGEEVAYRGRNFQETRRQIEPWETVLHSVVPYTARLEVAAIRLESPGWINLLGHLNPLKTIADFISKWRAENTKRIKLEMDSNARREELALEREKMNRKFAMDVLGHIPEGHGQALRFAEIAERTINPSLAGLDRLLADSRVIDAEVVDGNSVDKGIPPTMRKIRLKDKPEPA
jgi:hypothetical protein